jgi:stage II sporulation protein D
VLRRALLLISFALLGLAGVASAKLVADPTDTTPIAGGPIAVTTTGPETTTTTPPFTTSVATTTTAPTTTAKSVTTARATTTTVTTTTTTTTPKLAESSSASTLVISGHGWGHAIGMAQWGADGYAQHGWDFRRILAHYYQGTTVAAGPSPTVRVLLLDGARRVTLASDSPWKVVDRTGTTVSLPTGTLKVAADLVVSGQTLVSPLTFSPGATPLQVGKASYHGKLLVVSNGTKLQIVNELGLESYVLGVVGREMPSTWPAAALETQAVAARSYALAELENVVTARAFDLYNDDRSQVYGGIAAESSRVTAAVQATARQVVLYGGKVATTYFSSSSGGRTVSAGEAWGKPIPYLVSVDDPYDTLSPYHDWGPVLLDARKAGAALKVPGALASLILTTGPSGRVASVDAIGTKGNVKLTASAVRAALGLRSTWFTVGWLALTPPVVPLAYGGTTSLTGVARGVQGVVLEAKGADGVWETLSSVTPAADGSFTVAIRPPATTQYRLAAGDIRAALLKVAVAPLVSASLAAGIVQGTMKPALSGAAVQVQRQDGVGWTTVATGTTDVSGAFTVSTALSPGAYRVRCAPGRGLSPGVSQPVLQT